MNLADIIRVECVKTGLDLPDKAAVLRTISQMAANCPALKAVSEETLFQALEAREAMGSTGFGNGIAIPHCRLEGVQDFVVGLVTMPRGVDFEALDGQPVRVAVFIIGPEDQPREQIRILSGVSRVLSIPGNVNELAAAPTPEALRESFLRHATTHLAPADEQGRNLFYVLIQNEDLFREVLQVFSAMEQSHALVLDAENVSAYLSNLPLFAGFWTDPPNRFARLVVALVNKRSTNETIRQIEEITGSLNRAEGILVAVQEIFFCAGSLLV